MERQLTLIETHSVWLNKFSFTKTWHTDDTALTAEGPPTVRDPPTARNPMVDIKELEDIK